MNIALRIFQRLWNALGDANPVVIHISIKAPALREKYHAKDFDGFLKYFSRYLHYFEGFPDQPSNYLLIPIGRIREKVDNHFAKGLFGEYAEYDEYVTSRIPAKYLVKYES